MQLQWVALEEGKKREKEIPSLVIKETRQEMTLPWGGGVILLAREQEAKEGATRLLAHTTQKRRELDRHHREQNRPQAEVVSLDSLCFHIAPLL